MTDERPSDVLGALPRTRPHRRSDKRAKPNGGQTTSPKTTEAQEPAGRKAAATRKAATGAKGTAGPKSTAGPKAAATTKPATPRARKSAAPTPLRTAAPRRKRREEPLSQPAQPPGTPTPRGGRRPPPPSGVEILSTAVQAVAELTEIGLTASARALRNAVSRLPRP